MTEPGGQDDRPPGGSGVIPSCSGVPSLAERFPDVIPAKSPSTELPSSSPMELKNFSKILMDLQVQIAAMAASVNGLQARETRVSNVPIDVADDFPYMDVFSGLPNVHMDIQTGLLQPSMAAMSNAPQVSPQKSPKPSFTNWPPELPSLPAPAT